MLNNIFADKIKYPQLIEENKNLESQQIDKEFSINIISNITNFQLKPILEYVLRKNYLYVKVNEGEYDNIVQDSFNLKNNDCVIIFWEIMNFGNNFISDYKNYSSKEKKDFIKQKKKEITLVINNLASVKLVLFNEFFLSYQVREQDSIFNELINDLNNFLHESILENTNILYLSKIFDNNSESDLISIPKFEKFKMPYTLDFYWGIC